MNDHISEWKTLVSTVKAHEQFKSYALAKVLGILKSHEDEVTKEAKLVSSAGSLVLVAKGKKSAVNDSESDFSDDGLSIEDRVLMVSNPKKFFKNNFSQFRNKYK